MVRDAHKALASNIVEGMRVHVDLKIPIALVESVLRARENRLAVVGLQQVALRTTKLVLFFRVNDNSDGFEAIALNQQEREQQHKDNCQQELIPLQDRPVGIA